MLEKLAKAKSFGAVDHMKESETDVEMKCASP